MFLCQCYFAPSVMFLLADEHKLFSAVVFQVSHFRIPLALWKSLQQRPLAAVNYSFSPLSLSTSKCLKLN